MDKRIKYIIGIDTETCNGLTENGKTDLSQSLTYDIGWEVTDQKGREYFKRSFVVRELFIESPELMKSAYYAKKIPKYWEDIKSGKRKLANFLSIYRIFREDCRNYNVKAVFAHNSRFDLTALNNTLRYLTGSRKRYFFPYGVEIWDTWKMAKQVIVPQKGYQIWCNENNYLMKNGQPRATAEILTRYLTGNNEFEESHTGLEDVEIETKILAHCIRQHKKMDKRLFSRR